MEALRQQIRESDEALIKRVSGRKTDLLLFLSAVNLTMDCDFGSASVCDEEGNFSLVTAEKKYVSSGSVQKRTLFEDVSGKKYSWVFPSLQHNKKLVGTLKSMNKVYDLFRYILDSYAQDKLALFFGGMFKQTVTHREVTFQALFREFVPGMDVGGELLSLSSPLDWMFWDTGECYRASLRNSSVDYLSHQIWFGYSLQLVMAPCLLKKDLVIFCRPSEDGAHFIKIGKSAFHTGTLPDLKSFAELAEHDPEVPALTDLKERLVIGSYDMMHFHRMPNSKACMRALKAIYPNELKMQSSASENYR